MPNLAEELEFLRYRRGQIVDQMQNRWKTLPVLATKFIAPETWVKTFPFLSTFGTAILGFEIANRVYRKDAKSTLDKDNNPISTGAEIDIEPKPLEKHSQGSTQIIKEFVLPLILSVMKSRLRSRMGQRRDQYISLN